VDDNAIKVTLIDKHEPSYKMDRKDDEKLMINASSLSQNITHMFKRLKQTLQTVINTRDNQHLRPSYHLHVLVQ